MSRRGLVILLVAVLVVAGLGAGWWGIATARANAVAVTWPGIAGTTDLAACRGAVVRQRRLFDWPQRVPVLPARRGMDCSLPVLIRNNSSGTVTIKAIQLPYMGPGGGAETRVPSLGDMPFAPRYSRDRLDAAFRVDRELAPGESYRVVVRFRHRDSGCNSGTMGIGNFPTVHVSALGIETAVQARRSIAFRGSGKARGCHDTRGLG